MWLIRKQVTWPITRCFNDYDSGAGKEFGQTPCSLSSRRSKESYCRPHPGLLSRKRVIALLRLFFFVRGEETVPAVFGDDLWAKGDHHQYYLQPFIISCISLPPSLPIFDRVPVPSSGHKDCRLSIHPFHNQAVLSHFCCLQQTF